MTSTATKTLDLLVRQVTRQAERINSYELVHPFGDQLPPFSAGSHLDVYLPGGTVRQYSLCNDPEERHRYLLGVLHDMASRGGSRALHEQVTAGSTLKVSMPRNHFALCEDARSHMLIAGGIGVTPLKAMVHRLERIGASYVLHYCVRTPELTAFGEAFAQHIERKRVVLHHDHGRPERQLDLSALLREPRPGTHLYYCGPAGFMRACAQASAHWPEGTVHCEYFAAPDVKGPAAGIAAEQHSGVEFQVRLQRSGRIIDIPRSQSIAEVLMAQGVEVDTSCRAGLCGTCRVDYLEGEVDHRDFVLTDDERRRCMTACVSRSRRPLLVLDL